MSGNKNNESKAIVRMSNNWPLKIDLEEFHT
jgi:hypothetical protein